MDALILAAGFGKRLRPLTLTTPKPLISVGHYRLIEIHLLQLHQHGFKHVVINLSYLGEQIEQHLGNGSRYGVSISYSYEPEGALETAGGIIHALPLIRSESFLLVNGDVLTDYPFSQLKHNSINTNNHLVLVDNPPQHPTGDFHLTDGRVNTLKNKQIGLTYSGIAYFQKSFFTGLNPGPRPLGPLLKKSMQTKITTGERYRGLWQDIGTVERLNAVKSNADIQAWISALK